MSSISGLLGMGAPLPDSEVSVPSKTGDSSRDEVSAAQSQYLVILGWLAVSVRRGSSRVVACIAAFVAEGFFKLVDVV